MIISHHNGDTEAPIHIDEEDLDVVRDLQKELIERKQHGLRR